MLVCQVVSVNFAMKMMKFTAYRVQLARKRESVPSFGVQLPGVRTRNLTVCLARGLKATAAGLQSWPPRQAYALLHPHHGEPSLCRERW